MKVLLVKMSSLGDIVHTLPAVADAAQRGFRFDWVVEESYKSLPAQVPGVDDVLPVALRRWRRAPHKSGAEIRAFRRRLRRRSYDLVLDAQGLIKSAAVGLLARGRERAGFDAGSVRERLAALAYRRHVRVARREHAIARSRRLFASALNYDLPATAPAFGLAAAAERRNHVVLAHGASWHNKLWPEAFWVDIARRATAAGLTPLLPSVDSERGRAERIAGAVSSARACSRMDLASVLELVSKSTAVVGVDSGLAHFAAAVGLPTVMLFGPTDPRLTGCRGPFARNLAASLPCSPCHSRRCRYRLESGSPGTVDMPCLSALAPRHVWRELTSLMASARASEGDGVCIAKSVRLAELDGCEGLGMGESPAANERRRR